MHMNDIVPQIDQIIIIYTYIYIYSISCQPWRINSMALGAPSSSVSQRTNLSRSSLTLRFASWCCWKSCDFIQWLWWVWKSCLFYSKVGARNHLSLRGCAPNDMLRLRFVFKVSDRFRQRVAFLWAKGLQAFPHTALACSGFFERGARDPVSKSWQDPTA